MCCFIIFYLIINVRLYLTKHDLVHIMLSVWDRRDWMEEVVVWIYYCKKMNNYYVGKNLVEKSGGDEEEV